MKGENGFLTLWNRVTFAKFQINQKSFMKEIR
jgi:hypothetical protein